MYTVQAFVAHLPTLKRATAALAISPPVALPQGFALLPNTDTLQTAIPEVTSFLPTSYSIFEHLTPPLLTWVLSVSRQESIMYFETDYFGGQGTQSAVSWHNGLPLYGPAKAPRGPINNGLQTLGVICQEGPDAFDTLRLDSHRTTVEWLR